MVSLHRARRGWSWLATPKAALFGLLILLVSITGLVAWWRLDVYAEDQAKAAASRGATMVAQDVARTIEQIDQTLQTVIGGRQAPQSSDIPPQERRALLAERTPRDRYVSFIDVIGADGGILASTRPGQELKNWSDRDYFWAQRNGAPSGPYIGRPFATTRDETAAVPISHRIDRDGQFAGVVVAALRLAYFRDLFGGLQPGSGDTATLLNDDGVILMRVPFDLNDVGRKVTAVAAVHDFIHGGPSATTERASDAGSPRETALHQVANLPLMVSVSVPIDQGWKGWLIGLGATVAVMAAVLAAWIRQETQARKGVQRESQEKSRFLTNLSHELRTPLQAVLGYADRLSRDSSLSRAQAHDVDAIIRAGRQMRDEVNVVLDYARLEAIGPTLRPQRIELRPLIEESIALVEPGAKARGLQTRITLGRQAPTHFVTDANQLRHILANLLSNAVKYTPRGMVECRVKGDPERLIIEVADTGIGIPHEQRHRLFKEFERFGAERTGIEGTGLGLSSAHRLARLMGGHMGHRDNVGGGSVFWLELPASAEQAPPLPVDIVQPAPAPVRALNVLIVDDSAINRELMSSFLHAAGHCVREARDGAEAVQMVAAQDYDVVLMDMRMAGMDGLEATRAIRALKGPRGCVPIVAVTANAFAGHAEECRRAGMSEHLAKPFAQAELLAAVARAATQGSGTPDRIGSAIDDDIMAQLVASVGESGFERLLDQLAVRIEALLRQIEDPEAATTDEVLADLAHELIGSAGTLGVTGLAEAASRYEAALAGGGADASEMRSVAIATLSELRTRRSLEALVSH
jgi:signal transduction histidine kinase/DNA-binding NarL/FixJ family response regulator